MNGNDIHDIKPPLEIPNPWVWLWFALGLLAVLAIVFIVWCQWKKSRSQVAVEPVVPAHIRAKEALQKALEIIGQPKSFCILVSDTVRIYLEERFDFRAPERTTEEFLRELSATDLLTGDQKESLGRFLESCDLVKFAKYEPGENELREWHSSAVRLVEETEPEEDLNIEPQASSATVEQKPNTNRVSEKIVPAAAVPSTNKAQIFAVIGTSLQLAPIIWFLGNFILIYRCFKLDMDAPSAILSHSDVTSPGFFLQTANALSAIFAQELSIIRSELWLILILILIGIVGLIFLVISLTPFRYRAEWFFWFLMVYGVLLVGSFPFGTLFGIFFLVYCLTKRREFFK